MSADNILFRASCIGKIMTDARSKSEPLGETCKKYLVEKYVNEVYGREKDIDNKFIEKGNAVEEDSLTLYCRSRKPIVFLKKNQKHLTNKFLSGTPDIITETEVIDLKSSWDIFTFFNAKTGVLNKDYYYQLQAYMALTDKNNAKLVYCLVNTPDHMIEYEKYLMYKKSGIIDDTDSEYLKAAKQLEKNMRYDDIPMADRVHEIQIPRNDADITSVYERIRICRQWMNENLFKVQLTQAA